MLGTNDSVKLFYKVDMIDTYPTNFNAKMSHFDTFSTVVPRARIYASSAVIRFVTHLNRMIRCRKAIISGIR